MPGCGMTRRLACLWLRVTTKPRILLWRRCGPLAARSFREFLAITGRPLRRAWESLMRHTLPRLAYFELELDFITTIWRKTDGWTRLPRSTVSICRMEAGRAR